MTKDDGAMRMVADLDGNIRLDGEFHVFINGEPAFDGDKVYEDDLIKLKRKPMGPFVRPTRWERIVKQIAKRFPRLAWRLIGKGRDRVTIDME